MAPEPALTDTAIVAETRTDLDLAFLRTALRLAERTIRMMAARPHYKPRKKVLEILERAQREDQAGDARDQNREAQDS
jgi:hypothetical protein